VLLSKTASRLIQAAFLIAIVIGWYFAAAGGHVSPILLPPPDTVFQQVVSLIGSGAIVNPLRTTVYEVIAGFLIAAVAGLFTGYLISRTRYTIVVFDPLLTSLYAIPAILFFPLYELFFGIGVGSKIALGTTIAFFPIVLSTIAGFGAIESTYTTAARTMGARGWNLFAYVLLPAAFPTVFAGLRIGLTLCFLSILGGETLASFAGLGHEIAAAASNMTPALMYAYIVFVICFAGLLNFILARAESFGTRG
jgi:ABC-type nitrate/sulfonate/bicarbonate transport system permease component